MYLSVFRNSVGIETKYDNKNKSKNRITVKIFPDLYRCVIKNLFLCF